MIRQQEKLYVSPTEFSNLNDQEAIVSAIQAAKKQQVNVVVIPPKPNGNPWHVTKPILLPDFFTVILSGCEVLCDSVAFTNERAFLSDHTLGTEGHKIFLLGRNDAKIRSASMQAQIYFCNARDCRIAGITFIGGNGILLNHFQYSKLQMLRFRSCRHAVTIREGCNNLILESVDAETEEEAILSSAEDKQVLARDPEIFNSILCRIRAKTAGAPAVLLAGGKRDLYNIVLRDLTDETEGGSASVVLGCPEDEGTVCDITVRGVQSKRDAVHTKALCDGNFYSNLHPGEGKQAFFRAFPNTRDYWDGKTMEIVLPIFREELPDRPFVTPCESRFFADGDGQTIQNAVDFASKSGINCVVIPCWNVRTQSAAWILERAVRLPSCMTVVFLHSYLRHADFMYENLFTNSLAYDSVDRSIAKEEHDLSLCGVGDAVLDGGKQNGLKEKTCFLYGLPDKRPNATVLFNNVRNMVLENFQIRDSRWYGMYYIHCDTVRVSGIDFDNGEDYCNRDGVDMRQGNHNFLVENITGVTGDDTIALNNLGNDGNDGRYVAGKDCDTLNMTIRNVKSDAGRWFTVRLLCQDRHLEHHFLLDTIMDVSRKENKKRVDAAVMVGSHEYHYKVPAEVGDLAHITIRDVYARANYAVALGGCSDDVKISNVHSYADGLSVLGLRGAGIATLVPKIIAHIRDVEADGLFYKRDGKELDPDVPNPKTLPIQVFSFNGLHTVTPLRIRNTFAQNAPCGIALSGQATVEIEQLEFDNLDTLAFCGGNCQLTVNGTSVPQTTELPL